MTLKLFLSVIVILCCAILGEMIANSYKERTQLLQRLVYTMQILETEIVYSLTPLPELLQKTGKKSHAKIRALLDAAAEELQKKQGVPFSTAWHRAINVQKSNLDLSREDLELLINLGNHLGTTDQDNQVKHIRLTMEGLKHNYEEALTLQNKNVSLYKHLGLLTGLTIVIILF